MIRIRSLLIDYSRMKIHHFFTHGDDDNNRYVNRLYLNLNVGIGIISICL